MEGANKQIWIADLKLIKKNACTKEKKILIGNFINYKALYPA